MTPPDLTLPDLTGDLVPREAARRLGRAFAEAGLPSAALDARLLLAEALGLSAAGLLAAPDGPIGPDTASRLGHLASRRLGREPVSRILGLREFWSLPFRLSAGTLVPRPETETVVEAALDALRHRRGEALRLLDLGTGSGALLVALLSEFGQAWGLATDRSPDALATARTNAQANGVGGRCAFLLADWAAPLAGAFDLVVSNPPYIRAGEIAGLDPEVALFDPVAALDGGSDGLAAYRLIVAALPRLLAPGGVAALEVGHDQAAEVATLGEAAGLALREIRSDLAGIPRVVVLAG